MAATVCREICLGTGHMHSTSLPRKSKFVLPSSTDFCFTNSRKDMSFIIKTSLFSAVLSRFYANMGHCLKYEKVMCRQSVLLHNLFWICFRIIFFSFLCYMNKDGQIFSQVQIRFSLVWSVQMLNSLLVNRCLRFKLIETFIILDPDD